jgi:hypothetical protein
MTNDPNISADLTTEFLDLKKCLAEIRDDPLYKDGKRGRRATIEVLRAIVIFLDNCEIDPSSSKPLSDLVVALLDLENNKVHPIIAPAKGTTPAIGIGVAKARQWAVLAVDLLIDRGCSVEDACRATARRMRAAGFPPFSRKADREDWKVLSEWRSEMQRWEANRNASPDKKAYARQYARLLQKCRKGSVLPETILSHLSHLRAALPPVGI